MKNFPALLACAAALALPLPAAEVAPQKTTLDCDRAEMWTEGNETRGVCEGSVVLSGTNIRITCDRLEFVATGLGDTKSTLPSLEKFKSMLATGHVVIVQADREATCGRAEVLPREDRVILTENPVVIDHGTDWTSAGEKITLLRGERRVIVEKSRVVGPAIKDLGFDKNKPPASAPAEAPKPAQP